jgi:hypothetical protein
MNNYDTTFYQKRVEDGQTIFDLALQEYGSTLSVFMLLEDNDLDIEIDLEDSAMLSFQILPIVVPNSKIMQQFRREQTRINNHYSTNVAQWVTADGETWGNAGEQGWNN